MASDEHPTRAACGRTVHYCADDEAVMVGRAMSSP